MNVINLEIVGKMSPHETHLCMELKKLGVDITVHSLLSHYKMSRIKFYKRVKLRNDLIKQMKTIIFERNSDNTVFFSSQPPTLYPPILKKLSHKFATIMDIRDIWQEHTYHSYLKRKIEQWEQVSTMNKVSAVTFVNHGFYNYLASEIKDITKLYFLSLGADRDVFYYSGSQEPLSDKSINLVWCGCVYKFHYVSFWIEVMNSLQKRKSDIHLTIAGYGDDEKDIQQKINDYQLKNVSFFNEKFKQEQLAQFLRRADYALAGCDPNFDFLYQVAISTKVYEALSCGTPLITLLGREMDWFNSHYGLSEINVNFNNFNVINNKITISEICDRLISLSVIDSITRKRIFHIAKVFSYRNIALTFKEILQNVLRRY